MKNEKSVELIDALQEFEDHAYHPSLKPDISGKAKALAMVARREQLRVLNGFQCSKKMQELWGARVLAKLMIPCNAIYHYDGDSSGGNKNLKIKICDALMGRGKTSSAINHMNSSDSKFIFITPYLNE